MEQEAELLRHPEHEQQPTEQDWLIVQGGIPELWLRPNSPSCLIIHNYHGVSNNPKPDGAVVPTALYQFKRPEVTLLLGGRKVKFHRALLWELHGQPCEMSSLRQSVEGYDRIDINNPSYKEDLVARGFKEVTFDELKAQLS